jgi:transcriptional regulator with XRE-family HTH domain
MDERQRLGRRIQRLRKTRGYMREQLAETIDINPEYLKSVERGEENPTLDLLLRLSTGLQVELPELFQFAQEGVSCERLRQKMEGSLADLTEDELRRVVRVLEALIR